MSRRRWLVGASRLIGTLAALMAGEAVLVLAGRRLPPLTDAGRMSRTFLEGDPLLVATSAVRLIALVLGAGLLAITALGIAARAVGAARLVTRLDRWTPPSLRRILDGALGAGLAASIGMSSLPANADPAPPPPPTLRRLADAPPLAPDPRTSATTLRRLPDAPLGPGAPPADASAPPDPSPRGAAHPRSPAAPPAAAATHGPGPPPVLGLREVAVAPGDSFWRLAERHQAERLGRLPSDGEVAACWTRLVALNRHRLVVPGDPDLLFPGQVVQLPCP